MKMKSTIATKQQTKALQSVTSIQNNSLQQGTDNISISEIDEEVRIFRKNRIQKLRQLQGSVDLDIDLNSLRKRE
jgi:hypothetical protein